MITLDTIGPNGLRLALEAEQRAEGGGTLSISSGRKVEFTQRLQIDQQLHVDLIRTRIRSIYQTTSIADLICRHVDTRRNVLRRVADAAAVAYDTPPTREVRGASDSEQRGLIDAYREAHTATAAETWGRYAFLCNVVHVLPRLVGDPGLLQWVTVLPHACDVIFDPAGECDPSILVYDTKEIGAVKIAVDTERWWWLSNDWKVIREEVHGLGLRPWAEFRVAARGVGDYWARGLGHDLVDATLESGRIGAHMAWTRKNNSQKLLVWSKNDSDSEIPPGQSADATKGVVVTNVGVTLYDTEVSPDAFQSELDGILEDVAESYGLPLAVLDKSATGKSMGGGEGERTVYLHEALVKLRNRQVKHLGHAEAHLATVTAALLRTNGRAAPDPKQVEAEFRIRFAPANYADHPKAQVETAQAQMELGATDPFEFYQSLHPELTYDEAKAEVLEHLEERAEFLDILTKRNMSSNPSEDSDTLAQLQGRIGGRMSGETRTPSPEDSGQDENENAD